MPYRRAPYLPEVGIHKSSTPMFQKQTDNLYYNKFAIRKILLIFFHNLNCSMNQLLYKVPHGYNTSPNKRFTIISWTQIRNASDIN